MSHKMKGLSIRKKVMLMLTLLIISIIILGLVMNKLYFKDYYLLKTKNNLLAFAREFDDVYGKDPAKEGLLIDKMIISDSVLVAIYDMENLQKKTYASETRGMGNGMGNGNGSGRRMDMITDITVDYAEQTMEKGHQYFTKVHSMLKLEYIGMSFKLNNGDILVVSSPMEKILISSEIATEFYLYIAGISLVLGGILAYLFSRRLTQPVLEINEIAKHITDLDFSKRYNGEPTDEIGMLGNNINFMSERLKNTLEEIKAANLQLQEDIQLKERLDTMRKEFIANVSHELKTPLALIMGYSEGLAQNINEGAQREHYCKVISSETEKMSSLVQDLLNLAEIEHDEFIIERKRFDLSALIDEVLDRYGMIIKERSIKVELVKEDIVQVDADKGRIEQVLTNLINNAIDHITGEMLLNIEIAENEKSVTTKIFNSGSSIPEEKIELIWDSFYKAAENNNKRIGGSGIGLSIVKKIVQRHDGQCGANNINGGIEFYFEIPKNFTENI